MTSPTIRVLLALLAGLALGLALTQSEVAWGPGLLAVVCGFDILILQ